jgi:hypothetical protein
MYIKQSTLMVRRLTSSKGEARKNSIETRLINLNDLATTPSVTLPTRTSGVYTPVLPLHRRDLHTQLYLLPRKVDNSGCLAANTRPRISPTSYIIGTCGVSALKTIHGRK